ncbi:hypothetical protein BLAT2472_20512 [Burkholderia latens]
MRVVRCSRRSPIAFSSAPIRRDSVEFGTPIASAAPRKLFALTTSTNNAMSFRSSIGLLHKRPNNFHFASFILNMGRRMTHTFRECFASNEVTSNAGIAVGAAVRSGQNGSKRTFPCSQKRTFELGTYIVTADNQPYVKLIRNPKYIEFVIKDALDVACQPSAWEIARMAQINFRSSTPSDCVLRPSRHR